MASPCEWKVFFFLFLTNWALSLLGRNGVCRLRHRGPDWSGLHCNGDCYLAHQRLAIMDPASGDQPLYNEDKTIVVTVLFGLWGCLVFI